MAATRIETDIICGLKAAVARLDCCQHMQTPKEPKKKKLPAAYITIPIQHATPCKEQKTKPRSKFKCDKRASRKSLKDSVARSQCKDKEKLGQRKKTPRPIFPEMRGSILYSRCYCLHRDGLQDMCPLTQCQGQPECLAKPWAVCPPGRYVRSRYPELYVTKSKKDCTT